MVSSTQALGSGGPRLGLALLSVRCPSMRYPLFALQLILLDFVIYNKILSPQDF